MTTGLKHRDDALRIEAARTAIIGRLIRLVTDAAAGEYVEAFDGLLDGIRPQFRPEDFEDALLEVQVMLKRDGRG